MFGKKSWTNPCHCYNNRDEEKTNSKSSMVTTITTQIGITRYFLSMFIFLVFFGILNFSIALRSHILLLYYFFLFCWIGPCIYILCNAAVANCCRCRHRCSCWCSTGHVIVVVAFILLCVGSFVFVLTFSAHMQFGRWSTWTRAREEPHKEKHTIYLCIRTENHRFFGAYLFHFETASFGIHHATCV